MRGLLHLLFFWGLGLGLAWGQGAESPLNRLVRLTPGERPLGEVLTELSRQSGTPFSYSSSRISIARRCAIRPSPARALGEVLRELLGAEQLSYGLLDGQLVLWTTREAMPDGVREVNGGGTSTPGPGGALLPCAPSRPVEPRSETSPSGSFSPGSSPISAIHRKGVMNKGPRKAVAGRHRAVAIPSNLTRALLAASQPLPTGFPAVKSERPTARARQQHPAAGRGRSVMVPTDETLDRLALAEELRPAQRLRFDSTGLPRWLPLRPMPVAAAPILRPAQTSFQLSVLPLLHSSGVRAPLTVNRYSLNLLVGRSAGVGKAEIGGLANVVRDTVRGLQVAGLLNATGTVERGVQLAGVANLNRGNVRGVQGATLLNVVRRDVRGLQFGLVNVAHRVHGVQLGLLNLADSVDGVSLGLLNLVRHGYLHGEVWASESLPLNAVVKVGNRPFYTLVGVAAEPFGNRVEWAGGAGLGTASRPRGRLGFSLDLVQWFLAGGDEEGLGQRFFTQLRPAVTWQIEKAGRLQLVAGPSLNLAIARRAGGRDRWTFGENQWLWLNTVDERDIIRLWPGAQLGLRF